MVIFGFTADEKGAPQGLRPVKVADLAVGPRHFVELDIPEAFVSAVRERLAAKAKPPPASKDGTIEFFTFFFFDPAQPHRTDVDPRNYQRQ